MQTEIHRESQRIAGVRIRNTDTGTCRNPRGSLEISIEDTGASMVTSCLNAFKAEPGHGLCCCCWLVFLPCTGIKTWHWNMVWVNVINKIIIFKEALNSGLKKINKNYQ